MLEHYLHTHDHQFRFKSQQAKDPCILALKCVIKCYIMQIIRTNMFP